MGFSTRLDYENGDNAFRFQNKDVVRGFKKVNSPIIKINDSHYGAKMSVVLPLMVFYLLSFSVRDAPRRYTLQKKYDDM